MKIKIALTAAMIVLLTGFSALGAAPEKKTRSEALTTEQAPMKKLPLEVSGVISKTHSGYFLVNGKKTLLLKGDGLMGAISDQHVKVIGTLVETEEGQPAIEVEKIIPTP